MGFHIFFIFSLQKVPRKKHIIPNYTTLKLSFSRRLLCLHLFGVDSFAGKNRTGGGQVVRLEHDHATHLALLPRY